MGCLHGVSRLGQRPELATSGMHLPSRRKPHTGAKSTFMGATGGTPLRFLVCCQHRHPVMPAYPAPYIAATGGCCSHLPVALLACLLWLARNHEKVNPRRMSGRNGYGYNPAACRHQRATMHGERPPRHARKLNSPKRTQCTNTQASSKRRRGLKR